MPGFTLTASLDRTSTTISSAFGVAHGGEHGARLHHALALLHDAQDTAAHRRGHAHDRDLFAHGGEGGARRLDVGRGGNRMRPGSQQVRRLRLHRDFRLLQRLVRHEPLRDEVGNAGALALGLRGVGLRAPHALLRLQAKRAHGIELRLEHVAVRRRDGQRRDLRHRLPGLHRVAVAQIDPQQPSRHGRGDAVAVDGARLAILLDRDLHRAARGAGRLDDARTRPGPPGEKRDHGERRGRVPEGSLRKGHCPLRIIRAPSGPRRGQGAAAATPPRRRRRPRRRRPRPSPRPGSRRSPRRASATSGSTASR